MYTQVSSDSPVARKGSEIAELDESLKNTIVWTPTSRSMNGVWTKAWLLSEVDATSRSLFCEGGLVVMRPGVTTVLPSMTRPLNTRIEVFAFPNVGVCDPQLTCSRPALAL